MRNATAFILVVLSPFLLGTTYIVRENGKKVGQWVEPDGRDQIQYIDNDHASKTIPSAPTSAEENQGTAAPEGFAHTEAFETSKISKPPKEMSLTEAMKAVPFIKATFIVRDGRGSSEWVKLGSGAFINPEGVLITNCHVVKDATKISVILYDEKYKGDTSQTEYSARVLRTYPYHDLAIVSANVQSLDYFKFAEPASIAVGNAVKAIGNPSGLQATVSNGIVSAIRTNKLLSAKFKEIPGESISEKRFENITWIQTDAAINPGNSGGPLLNEKNQLVGINTFTRSGTEGLGFASHVMHAIEFAEAYQKQ